MATTNGHPATPPPTTTTTTTAPDAKPAPLDPEAPLSSTQDDGLSRRPRDARLIHLILHAQGINSYQERVPLQLLDFAYRYTSGVLSDSLRLASEGYANNNERGNKRSGGGGAGEEGNITVQALRQAIGSRMGYTFQGALPKEFMMEEAAGRNQVALPAVERGFGVQVPPEKYCLTGVGWGLREEWSDEEDVLGQDDGVGDREDESMGVEEEGEEEEGAGRMEDVFGEGDTNMTQD